MLTAKVCHRLPIVAKQHYTTHHMKTHTTHRSRVRSSIAVFHYTGTDWIIVRGIKGTEVLGRYNTLRDAAAACSKHNQQLAKELGA